MPDAVLSDSEITAQLQSLPQWSLQAGALCRTIRTHAWPATLMVVNAIGHLAQVADHHPDLQVRYGSVVIRLSTHDAGGVTIRDVTLAEQIERVVFWNPAPGSNPPPYLKS